MQTRDAPDSQRLHKNNNYAFPLRIKEMIEGARF